MHVGHRSPRRRGARAREARRRASTVGSASPKAATSCSMVGVRSAGRPPRTALAMRSATSRSRTGTCSGSAMDVAGPGRKDPPAVSYQATGTVGRPGSTLVQAHGSSVHLPQLRTPHHRDRAHRRLPPSGQGLHALRLRLPLRAARRLLPGAGRRVLRLRRRGPGDRLRPRLLRADRPRRRARHRPPGARRARAAVRRTATTPSAPCSSGACACSTSPSRSTPRATCPRARRPTCSPPTTTTAACCSSSLRPSSRPPL